ncbi:MAG: hypothetical protein DRO87_12150 [Candidatus Thorarchaeota archaeon]|nr:MAG: hypothetical protein DRO87_12150 [Candidatus Thorarchaeota archaeon]
MFAQVPGDPYLPTLLRECRDAEPSRAMPSQKFCPTEPEILHAHTYIPSLVVEIFQVVCEVTASGLPQAICEIFQLEKTPTA